MSRPNSQGDGDGLPAHVENLVDALRMWRELISPSRAKMANNRHSVLWRSFIGPRVLPPLSTGFTALILGGALYGQTASQMAHSLRMCCVFFIINYVVFFWAGPGRAETDAIMLRLEDVARRLAPVSHGSEVALNKAARRLHTLMWGSKFYASIDVFTLIIPLALNQDRLEVKMWPWPKGRLWVLLGGIMQICLGAPFAFPAFLTISLYASFITVEIALYDVLTDALRNAATMRELKEVVMMDVELTSVGCRTRDLLASFAASLLASFLLTPLLSTMMVVQGQYDLFTIVSIPYIMVYTLICTFGQDIQDACVRVASAIYDGHWLEVRDPSLRALTILLMARRARPLSMTAGFGIGVLNLRACSQTLQSWYSFLQVLLKIF